MRDSQLIPPLPTLQQFIVHFDLVAGGMALDVAPRAR